MQAIRSVLSGLLSLFLIVVFLHWTFHPWPNPIEGQVIFYDLPGENVYFHLLAKNTGISLFEPSGRIAFGIILLVCSVILLIGPIRKWGAIFSLIFCGLLAVLQMTPLLPMELPLLAGEGRSDGGAFFYLSLACVTAAFLIIAINPRKARQ